MLQIDYRNGDSLYIQIKENYKKLILSGGLKENDLLPSVRNLASSLAINVNTVQRAYKELEQEGYIYSVPGKGNFVAEENEEIKARGIKEITEQLKELLERAKYLDLSEKEIVKIVSNFYKGGETND